MSLRVLPKGHAAGDINRSWYKSSVSLLSWPTTWQVPDREANFKTQKFVTNEEPLNVTHTDS